MKFIVLCGLLSVSLKVSADQANPIGKVVELLDDIKTQVDVAGKKESQLFTKFSAWVHNEIRVAEQTIEDKTSEVSELKSALENEEAFRAGKQMEMEKQIADLTQDQAELQNGTDRRAAEHKEYLKNEETLVSSIDALERSIVVLQKQQPSASPPAGAALLASGSNTGVASADEAPNLVMVASNLRKQLEHSSDLRLSPRQQEILDNLYRAAVDAQPSNAPSFLQINQGGPYESKTGGVTSTLQDVLDTTKKNRQKAMEDEKLAQNTFDTFEKALNMQIKSGEENLADIKNQIAQSQEVTSQKEASLRDAEEILKATQDHLAEVEAQQKATTANYKEREKKRSMELKTMTDAIRILTSDAAKKFSKQQTVGDDSDDGGDDAPPTFLQTQRLQLVVKQQAINVVRSASHPGLVLLALRSTLHHRSRDPFGKAKEMIRQMLEKLLAEANEEAEHNAWCVAETAKSEKSKKDKEKTVQKLQDRVDAMDAEVQTLGDDLDNLRTELSDMADAITQATTLRNEERAAAKIAIKDYNDAQRLLKNALTVLQEFYGAETDGGGFDDEVSLVQQDPAPEVPQQGKYKARTRKASGVIGILEIAIQDFHDQEQEATMNESASQEAYEQLTKESEIKRAVFLKDTEYKSRRKVKLEGDKARTSSDLRSYEKELSAVNDYIEKLKPTCTYSGDVYEERKRRREAELQSLQNALEVLNGQAVA